MAYIKPTTNISTVGPAASSDSDYLTIDGINPAFGSPLYATSGGFGIVSNEGTFEVLDALPLNRASVRAAVDSDFIVSVTLTADADSDLKDSLYVTPASI